MRAVPSLAPAVALTLGLAALAACSDPNPEADAGTPDAGATDDAGARDPIARGQDLYRGLRCANCHGADGRGRPEFPGAPILVGRSAEDIHLAVVEPCADVTSLACHPLKLPDMTADMAEDIAAYLIFLAADPSVRPDPGPHCDDVPGHICTLAGNGFPGNIKRDGILAREQHLFWPYNVTTDPQGRVVITDWNNYLIRRIEDRGCREVIDETGARGRDCPIVNIIGTSALGDDCTTPASPILAANTGMNHPVGVWYLPNGNIVLEGWHMWRMKLIPVLPDGSMGEIYCVFGNGRGFAGDGLQAGTNWDGMGGPTRFNLPSTFVRDRRGHWYVSDQGNLRIRIIRADADDAPDDAPPAQWVASLRNNVVESFGGGEPRTSSGSHRRTKADYSDSGDGGPIGEATFRAQFGFDALPQMRLAIDNDRNLLYVADSENHRIRVIDLSQDPPVIDTFAGGGDDVVADGVDAREAKLFRPADVDVYPDGSGDILITDVYNNCVRWVEFATRTIRTVAGICGERDGYGGDGGPALEARLGEPGGAGVGMDRTVYIADTLNHRIRRVNPLR